jgi:trehalose 6-phosphate phosphatase
MQKIPLSVHQHALFLDFDGTLVDIAPHPGAVQVHAGMVGALQSAYQLFGGALAIVSGRCVAEVDRFLAPLTLPVSGEHGAQWRNSGGDIFELDVEKLTPLVAPILQAAQHLVNLHPSLLLEQKTAGFALHYRMAPALYTLCWHTLAPMVQRIPALALMRGKYVLEVAPSAVDKGTAVQSYLRTPPFAGRTPIFIGDDVTDEAGFAAAQAVGGYGVKVGAGPSVAAHRCPNPAALRAWLEQAAAQGTPAAGRATSLSPHSPANLPIHLHPVVHLPQVARAA